MIYKMYNDAELENALIGKIRKWFFVRDSFTFTMLSHDQFERNLWDGAKEIHHLVKICQIFQKSYEFVRSCEFIGVCTNDHS